MPSPASSDVPPPADILESGSAELACFTAEELEAVAAGRDDPDQGPPRANRLSSYPEEARQAVLVTALRGLIARGAVRPPSEAELSAVARETTVELEALGELHLILSLRANPSMIAFVGQQDVFSILYGFQPDPGAGLMEERISPQDLHTFAVWNMDALLDSMVDRIDPGALTTAEDLPRQEAQEAPPNDIADALRSLAPGVTRIDAHVPGPAGPTRLGFGVYVGPAATWVAFAVLGLDLRPSTAFVVNRGGLRECLRLLLIGSEPQLS